MKNSEKECNHENTEAIPDPLNTFYGVSYKCIDCGKYINIDEYHPPREAGEETGD